MVIVSFDWSSRNEIKPQIVEQVKSKTEDKYQKNDTIFSPNSNNMKIGTTPPRSSNTKTLLPPFHSTKHFQNLTIA